MTGTLRNSRPERRVGTRIAHRYRLDRLVANGGMAQVWEATDETLRRRVAVKILHDHLYDASTVARFRAEGVTAARLTHPGVVSIFDTCSHQGLDAIVMEYVDGPTLRDMLDRHGAFDVKRSVAVALEIADALGAAHDLDLVHRDVKPANVLVAPDGAIKVTDFGIAKFRDAPGTDLTLPGTFLGTAKYLAPEQVEGDQVDARSDIYSLGVVLYELLSGRVPFDGPTDAAIALARLRKDPPPLRDVAPHVSPELAAVVERCLARRPDERPRDMLELRIALSAADLSASSADRTTVLGRGADLTAVQVQPDVAPAPRFAESERGWLVPAVFVTVVALSLALAAVLIGQSDAGHRLMERAKHAVGSSESSSSNGDETPAGTPIAALGAFSFDPDGDQVEHDRELHALIDGDPVTTWNTERYHSRTFGIKGGVGVYLDLGGTTQLGQLEVTSPTEGWAATVHVADTVSPSINGWGSPRASRTDIDPGATTFDLGGARGRYVLLWITDLGSSQPARTSVSALVVRTA